MFTKRQKKDDIIDYCKNNKLELENIAFVGMVKCLSVMKIVGAAICPADSAWKLKFQN